MTRTVAALSSPPRTSGGLYIGSQISTIQPPLAQSLRRRQLANIMRDCHRRKTTVKYVDQHVPEMLVASSLESCKEGDHVIA